MTSRTLAVVSAGLGQPSSTSLLAGRLAGATSQALLDLGIEVEVTTVELRTHAHDLTDHLLTGFATETLQAAKDAVVGADGLVAVTPIFSASYNGLFKTFFDVLDRGALRETPVLLGATAGTARHSLALEHAVRPLFAHLGALTNPTAVFAAAEDWGNDATVEGGLAARIQRAATELAGLVASRETAGRVDPFGDVTPFSQLLSAG
ncbi:FMN reductase [Egicoccus halophilus]|uniref:FMN reductase n=1 Tax=Egicoccus halophilus TaxID=1670830 RepID=A0A8J3AH17_9ACTN|nr:FMN reductase [Egicoccus halophilus]GGI08258.1 FMN reductase [Egicoccus halophilus]